MRLSILTASYGPPPSYLVHTYINHLSVDQELEEKQQFPECNSRWTEKDGATVWCTESSGGTPMSEVHGPHQSQTLFSRSTYCCAQASRDPGRAIHASSRALARRIPG